MSTLDDETPGLDETGSGWDEPEADDLDWGDNDEPGDLDPGEDDL